MELFQSVARMAIIIVLNITNMVLFYEILMERKTSIKSLIGYLFLWCVVWKVGVYMVLAEFFYHELWYQILRQGSILFFAIYFFVILNKTYEGGLLKTVIGGMIAEICCQICSSGMIFLINFLFKKDVQEWTSGAFYIGDMCLVVGIVVSGILMRHYLGALMRKYREIQFKFSYLWWGAVIIFQIIAYCDQIAMSTYEQENLFTKAYQFFLIIGIWTFILIFLLGVWESRQIQKEHIYLDMKKRLLEEYFTVLRNQEQQVKKYQQDIDYQMKILAQLNLNNIDNQKEIQEYLQKLYVTYQTIKRNVYCNDLEINALINNKQRKMKNANLLIEIQNMILSEEKKRKLLFVLNEILDEMIELNRKVEGEYNIFGELKVAERKKRVYIQYAVYQNLRQEGEKKCIYRQL